MLNQTLSDSSHYGAEAHIGVFSLDTDKFKKEIKMTTTNQKPKQLSFDEQSEILHGAQSNINYNTKELPVDSIHKKIDLSNFKPTWSTEQQSSFIKSLLLGIPTQFSIFTRNDHNQVIVLDGKNRVHAIQQFINDNLVFCDNDFLLEFNGLSYSQLSASIKRKLLEKTIRTTAFANKSVPLVAKTLGITHDTN